MLEYSNSNPNPIRLMHSMTFYSIGNPLENSIWNMDVYVIRYETVEWPTIYMPLMPQIYEMKNSSLKIMHFANDDDGRLFSFVFYFIWFALFCLVQLCSAYGKMCLFKHDVNIFISSFIYKLNKKVCSNISTSTIPIHILPIFMLNVPFRPYI